MDSVLLELIWRYETREIKPDEAVEMFRRLIKSGEVWSLSPHYIEQATRMINSGVFGKGEGH